MDTIEKVIILPLGVQKRMWALKAVKENNGNEIAAAKQLGITLTELKALL